MTNAFIHDGNGKIFNDSEQSILIMVKFSLMLSIQC